MSMGWKFTGRPANEKFPFFPGIICSTTGRYRNFIRISCGYPWSEEVEKGIRILAEIIAKMM